MVQLEGGATELHANPLQEAPKGYQQFDSNSWQTDQGAVPMSHGRLEKNQNQGGGGGCAWKSHATQRQLVPRDSDVTMASEDIPDMFKSPASKKAKKGGSGLEKPSPFATSGLEKPPPSAASGLEKPPPSAASGLEKPPPSSC